MAIQNLLRGAILLAAIPLLASAALGQPPDVFREDFRAVDPHIPAVAADLTSAFLGFERLGPGAPQVKLSHHPEIENDPHYLWNGLCPGPVLLAFPFAHPLDLSDPGTTVGMRTKNVGGAALRLAVRTRDGWFVQARAVPQSDDWREHVMPLHVDDWRSLDDEAARVLGQAARPDFASVDAIGFLAPEAGGGSGRCIRLDWFALRSASAETALSERGAPLDGRRITLSDHGAWCWYQDERVIVDVDRSEGPMLLASSVSFGPGTPDYGDCNLHWCDVRTGATGRFELHDRLEADDHDNAALWRRPDGRYLAVYTRHSTDRRIRWRVSTRAHDPTAWSPERTLENAARVCYSNVFPLADADGRVRLFNFSRSDGFDPNWFVSDDLGESWAYGGKLHTGPDGNEATSQRPYLKYAAGGTDALHFITTDGHPRNEDNSIYHGVLARGRLTTSDGTVLGDLSRVRTSPHRSDDFTVVLERGARFGDVAMHRAWTVDLHVDDAGNPYAAITARANDDPNDHRFLYARWTGEAWRVVEIARAGGYLYEREKDYTGLAALHPHDPDVVFISTPIDPRDDARLAHYEIFMGRTGDGGRTWTWSPLTWGSDRDNLRPTVPIWDAAHTALLWLHGEIETYTSWRSELVLRMVPTGELEQLIAPGQSSVTRAAVLPAGAD